MIKNPITQVKRIYHRVGRNIQGRPQRLRAVLVSVNGSVAVSGHEDYCHARIHGESSSSLCLVLNTVAPAWDGLTVLVEQEHGVARFTSQYKVVGIWSGNADYEEEPLAAESPLHSNAHERMSYGARGYDPLDVHTRMVVEGRVDPTSPPSMAVHIAYIRYRWAGQLREFSNTVTAALVAPSTPKQAALIYFILAQNAYGIRYGPPGNSAIEPGTGEGEYPLASIYLTSTTTSIIDSMIIDRRDILALNALALEGGGEVALGTFGGVEQTFLIEASNAGPDVKHNLLTMSLPVVLM